MNALYLLGGVLLALWTPATLQAPMTWALSAAALLLVFSRNWRPALFLFGGFLYAQYCAGRVLDIRVDCDERRLVQVQIGSVPARTDAGWEFDGRLWTQDDLRGRGLRARLSYPGAQAPAVGERWQLLVQFAAEEAAGNEVARRNLLRDRISVRARVRPSALNQRIATASWSIDVLRERVARRISQRVADPAAAGLLSALAVGVTGEVSAFQWRVFNATGITHLVAISGMHVTFFAVLCMGLARLAWRRLRVMALWWRRESFAAGTGVTLAFAYALLSGFSVPAQRTAVMLAAFLVARCCARTPSPSWSVGVAAISVLLFDPLAALSAGFWLSFCAVAAIILLAGGRLVVPPAWRGAVHVQWVVTVALMPLTILLFGSFSLIGPLVNAVAIPVFTFALVPPLLVATALYLCPGDALRFLADFVIDATAWVATAGWPYLARSADWSWSLLDANPGFWWFCLALPAALAALLPLPARLRMAAAGLLCSALLSRAARPATGELQVSMLDVGGSRAVLLRTARHQLLLGTGESFGGAGRRFESRVLPELSRAGDRGLDLLVLDRADRDSLQALLRADARLRVGAVVTADARRIAPELTPCRHRLWQWDGVEFTQSPAAGGCWISAKSGGYTFLAAPERISGAVPDGPAQVLLLPRAARDAGAVLEMSAGPAAWALASVSGRDWRTDAWRRVREQPGGARLVSTATEGSVRVTLGPKQPPRLQRLARSRPGIWSTPPKSRCRPPDAGRRAS